MKKTKLKKAAQLNVGDYVYLDEDNSYELTFVKHCQNRLGVMLVVAIGNHVIDGRVFRRDVLLSYFKNAKLTVEVN